MIGLLAARLRQATAWIAIGLSGLAAVLTIRLIWMVLAIGYVDIPWIDEFAHLIPAEMLDLFAHHNEHLIAFPRIIFWLDDYLFAGRGQFTIALIMLIQACQAALFILMAWHIGYRSKEALIFVGCMVLVLSFAICQRENFISGFQISFISAFAAFTAGAFAVARYALTNRSRWLVGAVVGGLISAGSLASGLFALPILTIQALALRRMRATLVLFIAAIVAVITYLAEYRPLVTLTLRTTLLQKAEFLFALLGNPWTLTFNTIPVLHFSLSAESRMQALWVGGFFALATTLALFSVPLQFYGASRKAEQTSGSVGRLERWAAKFPADGDPCFERWNFSLALSCIILFGIMNAIITSVGRGCFGLDSAVESRYATAAIPLLISTSLLLGLSFKANAVSRLLAPAAGVFLLAFAGSSGALVRIDPGLRSYKERIFLSLAVGVQDTSLLPIAFYKLDATLRGIDRIRRDRKSLFSEPWVEAMGTPLHEFLALGVGGQCEGNFQPLLPKLAPTQTANRVFLPEGEVWAPHDQQPTPRILLANENGIVIGLGLIKATYEDFEDGGLRRRHELVHWDGELRPDATGEVTAYLLIGSGRRACEIGKSMASDKS